MTYQNDTSESVAVQTAPSRAETPNPGASPMSKNDARSIWCVASPDGKPDSDKWQEAIEAVAMDEADFGPSEWGHIARMAPVKSKAEQAGFSDYRNHRSPSAPADIPSVYAAPKGRIALHWVEDGATQIRMISPKWADAVALWLIEAVDETTDDANRVRQFSLKDDLGLSVDCVGGAVTMMSDRRLSLVQLGHDGIDRMIAELQEAKRESLVARGDPVPV